VKKDLLITTGNVLNSLQALRAIAAWMIVLHHFMQIYFNFHGQGFFGRFFSVYGRFGIDIFFVLSGFIIYRSTAGRNIDTLTFLRHRIARIVPAYWVFTILTALVILFFGPIVPYTQFSPEFFLSSIFFIPMNNPSGIGMFPLLTMGWTLDFDVVFYLVFALTLFLPKRWRLIYLFIGIIEVRYLFPYFYRNNIFFEFLMGVSAAALYSKNQRWVCPLWVGLGLGCFSLFILIHYVGGTVYNGIAAVLLLVAALTQEHRFNSNTFITRLGDWSYSTYLSHAIVLGFAYKAYKVLRINAYITLALACITIIGISWISFNKIERPIIRWVKKQDEKNKDQKY
jgi:hypothetical protein